MRVMLDTNVIISAFIFRSKPMNDIIKLLANNYSLVLCSFIIDELHDVVNEKFNAKTNDLKQFLSELPFELVHTPKILPVHNLFKIRDDDDEKVLYSAISANVDVLVTGDKDFYSVEIERPEILSPTSFLKKFQSIELMENNTRRALHLKIAIRIDVSNEIGAGHYLRMSALSDAFSELGHQCTFFKGEDEPVDYSPFDIVILDTYQVNGDYIAALNSPGRLVVCYDDNALYTYNCDILLNANLHAHELNFRFGEKVPRLLLGSKYTLLRREFRESPLFVVREHAKRIFVCFGGSDLRNMTPKAVRILQEIDGVHLSVVLGPYTKNDEEVFTLANVNTSVYKAPESISEIMLNCDIAVTAAGSMIYELAALGLPTIAITQADNQLIGADYMTRRGLINCIGSWESVDPDKLKRTAASLLTDFTARKSQSSKLIETVNKNGAINAAREIINICRI